MGLNQPLHPVFATIRAISAALAAKTGRTRMSRRGQIKWSINRYSKRIVPQATRLPMQAKMSKFWVETPAPSMIYTEHVNRPMDDTSSIPERAETLKVLVLMGNYAPIMMLGDDPDGFGTRWTLHGQQVQPVIAQYLMRARYIAENGETEMGAKTLALTAAGIEFRTAGELWWKELSLLQRLKVRIFG
jgi:hypothetical protein